VIFIDELNKILNILYPDRIRPEDLCKVYEIIRPQIQKLIDGVALGYDAKLIDCEPVKAVVAKSWMEDISQKNSDDDRELTIFFTKTNNGTLSRMIGLKMSMAVQFISRTVMIFLLRGTPQQSVHRGTILMSFSIHYRMIPF